MLLLPNVVRIVLLLSTTLCSATPLKTLTPSPPSGGSPLPQPYALLPSNSRIDQRSTVNLGQGWRLWYNTYSIILPVKDGAEALNNLFQQVSDRALGTWSSRDPSHYVKVTLDYLELQFFSWDPIPWSNIGVIAGRMLVACDNGFNGMFDMRFVHIATGSTIFAHLRIRLVAAAA
jgi:hypothetical protein